MPKFCLTKNTTTLGKHVLYQIKALETFDICHETKVNVVVEKGTLGGYIEKVTNLSKIGPCWVQPDSFVTGDAVVKGNSVINNSKILGTSVVDNTLVYNSDIRGSAVVVDSFVWNSNVNGKTTVKNSRLFESKITGKASLLDCTINSSDIEENAIICGQDTRVESSTVKGYTHIRSGKLFESTVAGNSIISGILQYSEIVDCRISGEVYNTSIDGKVVGKGTVIGTMSTHGKL